jgi:3-methyladenine DNA glycosylase AlkD
MAFSDNGEFDDTLRLSEKLLYDQHDLIHKAVGWLLREVGKKDQAVLEGFLGKYSKEMPRTMLRYSIEKLDAEKRTFYMQR